MAKNAELASKRPGMPGSFLNHLKNPGADRIGHIVRNPAEHLQPFKSVNMCIWAKTSLEIVSIILWELSETLHELKGPATTREARHVWT
jgi:hypothetical protein